jgi:N-acetyl-D-muramate 6-phosphate phosphatase
MTNICPYEAVLFDLDGTLLDTALDLGLATNYVLAKYGVVKGIDDDTARKYASDGMRALLRSGIATKDQDNYDFEKMRLDFLPYYYSHINERTVFFKDMDKLVKRLNDESIPIGIVTSKPHHLTVELLSKFKEFNNLKSVVGCDLIAESKPSPEPIFYACRELNVTPKNCIYVGDHERDIQAGHNAGMPTVLAGWGYLKDKSVNGLAMFGAEFVANDVSDLAKILGIEI